MLRALSRPSFPLWLRWLRAGALLLLVSDADGAHGRVCRGRIVADAFFKPRLPPDPTAVPRRRLRSFTRSSSSSSARSFSPVPRWQLRPPAMVLWLLAVMVGSGFLILGFVERVVGFLEGFVIILLVVNGLLAVFVVGCLRAMGFVGHVLGCAPPWTWCCSWGHLQVCARLHVANRV